MATDKLIASENLGGLHSGQRTSITPGGVEDRIMGQYGKAPVLLNPAVTGAVGPPVAGNPVAGIRGGSGTMRRRVSKGGFGGPAPTGTM